MFCHYLKFIKKFSVFQKFEQFYNILSVVSEDIFKLGGNLHSVVGVCLAFRKDVFNGQSGIAREAAVRFSSSK